MQKSDSIKEINPDVRVYSVHTDEEFPGIQGLQPGEIHSNLFEANENLVDGRFKISDEDVDKYWSELRHAGLEVGMSSGANLAGVLDLIKTENITREIQIHIGG